MATWRLWPSARSTGPSIFPRTWAAASACCPRWVSCPRRWWGSIFRKLTRGAARNPGPLLTRDEIVDRLRYHLGVLAEGEPVTYVEALEQARRQVIEELRPRPSA